MTISIVNQLKRISSEKAGKEAFIQTFDDRKKRFIELLEDIANEANEAVTDGIKLIVDTSDSDGDTFFVKVFVKYAETNQQDEIASWSMRKSEGIVPDFDKYKLQLHIANILSEIKF